MNADGSDFRQLTNGGDSPTSQPSFSADGKEIVFTRNRGAVPAEPEVFEHEIYVMNADGTDDRQVTRSGNDERPSFYPDGKTILFSSLRGPWRIRTIDVDGLNLSTQHPIRPLDENERPASPRMAARSCSSAPGPSALDCSRRTGTDQTSSSLVLIFIDKATY